MQQRQRRPKGEECARRLTSLTQSARQVKNELKNELKNLTRKSISPCGDRTGQRPSVFGWRFFGAEIGVRDSVVPAERHPRREIPIHIPCRLKLPTATRPARASGAAAGWPRFRRSARVQDRPGAVPECWRSRRSTNIDMLPRTQPEFPAASPRICNCGGLHRCQLPKDKAKQRRCRHDDQAVDQRRGQPPSQRRAL